MEFDSINPSVAARPPTSQTQGRMTMQGLETYPSPSEQELDPDAKLRAVLPLLKEYTGKLNDFSGNGHRKAGTKVPAPLQQYLIIAKRFAQFVSQRLTTAHDDFLTIELQLRLAEYEAALATAELQLR